MYRDEMYQYTRIPMTRLNVLVMLLNFHKYIIRLGNTPVHNTDGTKQVTDIGGLSLLQGLFLNLRYHLVYIARN